MGKLLQKLTATLLLAGLTPRCIFGATGDIYDLQSNEYYSREDISLLKERLRNKGLNENDLWVEDENGKLYNYSAMKQAERKAIIEVLQEHSVNLSDSEAIREAVMQYSSEIEYRQESKYAEITKRDIPEDSKSAGENLKIVKPSFTYNQETHSIDIEFEKTGYDGHFTVEVVGTLENNSYVRENTVQRDKFSISGIPDTYTMRCIDPTTNAVIYTTSLDFSKKEEFGQPYSDNEALITITGNPTDGYDINYAYDTYIVYTQQNKQVLKSIDSHVILDIASELGNVTSSTFELTGKQGKLHTDNIPYVRPEYSLNSGNIKLCYGDIIDGTYIPSVDQYFYLLKGEVDKNNRHIVSYNMQTSSPEITELLISLYRGEEKLYEDVYPCDSKELLEKKLENGSYHIVVKDNTSKILLYETDFEFEELLPTKIHTNSIKLTDDSETVQIVLKDSVGSRVTGETFNLEIKNDSTSEVKVIEVQDGTELELDLTVPFQTYTLTIVDGERRSESYKFAPSILHALSIEKPVYIINDETNEIYFSVPLTKRYTLMSDEEFWAKVNQFYGLTHSYHYGTDSDISKDTMVFENKPINISENINVLTGDEIISNWCIVDLLFTNKVNTTEFGNTYSKSLMQSPMSSLTTLNNEDTSPEAEFVDPTEDIPQENIQPIEQLPEEVDSSLEFEEVSTSNEGIQLMQGFDALTLPESQPDNTESTPVSDCTFTTPPKKEDGEGLALFLPEEE